MIPTFEQIVTCNFCHEAPAAGWVTDEVEGEPTLRSACLECAKKEGFEMTVEGTGYAEL